MRVPVVQGVIERRILANFRVEPDVLAAQLPAPFRPQIHRGWAVAGVCLIRLVKLRPKWLPAVFGMGSENAAHRAAVEWEDGGGTHTGVYIWRRDTNSRLAVAAGGRVFPGLHRHARFAVEETPQHLSVAMRSDDGATAIEIAGQVAASLPTSSIFDSVGEASDFFAAGSLGYSATNDSDRFEGLELRCPAWRVAPLTVESVASSFFDNLTKFPAGSIQLDHALLMRGVPHEWHGRADLCRWSSAVLDVPGS